MKINPTCSLNISTYNWPAALEVCLLSAFKQSVLPDEIIIADDGSRNETRTLIDELKKVSPVPVKHIWHADEGFRLAAIRNKAIAASNGEYLIQADGDLVFHQHFVRDHLAVCKPGFFVTGSRVIMDDALSKQIIASKRTNISRFEKGIRNSGNGMRNFLLMKAMKGYKKNKLSNLRGCNMSFWKQDLLKVNGYNEDFQGWGREDSELVVRLKNAGLDRVRLKYGGIVYHLYHKEHDRNDLPENDKLLRETEASGIISCLNGIVKL